MSMIHTGDCVEVMAGMPADSVDAVVTDPPYGLEFMGKGWDKFGAGVEAFSPSDFGRDGNTFGQTGAVHVRYGKPGLPFQAWCEAWGREALRVTKPGGYLLAFGGTRTHHRLVCGLEDAGWLIRDELTWVYACLSEDTELLTDLGWVPYNRASEATHAAAFDPSTGKLRWERIAAVHQYHHEGAMVAVGPSLTTLNHRVVLSPESEVPLPSHADLRGLWGELRDLGPVPGDPRQDVLTGLPIGADLGIPQGQDKATVGAQGPLVRLRGMRQVHLEAGRMGEAHHRTDVLVSVQRGAAPAVTDLPDRDAGRLDRGELGELPREDERPEQPSLEGRRYRVQEARELLWGSLRASAGMGEADGPQGRLPHGAPPTDGGPDRLPVDQDGVREPREPRPDRQPPREPDALAGQPDSQALRVGQGDRGDRLPPGDTPRLVDYAGVVWCITVPSGAFVARRNGIAFVTGNSGFPKGRANLKPAHEPIVLARKPGPLRALNIDECRIGTDGGFRNLQGEPLPGGTAPDGRWPSNLLLETPELFDVANPGVVGSGASVSSGLATRRSPGDHYSGGWPGSEDVDATYGDSGGYSRFFVIPKSDRSDREPTVRESTAEVYCNCKTVKPDGWVRPDLSQLAPMASTSRRRATSEAITEDELGSSTTLFGSSISDPSHQGSRSTTSTATSRTIESPTSSPSILSPISGSTPGQSSSTASGGSDARSAPPTDRSPRNGGTSAGRAGRSTGAADPAISPASSEISVCGDCGKPRSTAATGGADGVTRAARRNSHPT